MKQLKKILCTVIIIFTVNVLVAGNKDRVGQAGASELRINPWARSSGFNSLNTASVRGLEAMKLNIAGLAHTKGTEVLFARTNWLSGSDVSLNAFGFSQKVGETGVIGLDVMSIGFGDIPITTTNTPEGTGATYKPQYFNIGLGYSKAFSDAIFGGIVMRMVNEGLPDVKASGIAFDAGIQYVTGSRENIHFGIALRNLGLPMRFSGEGLTFRGDALEGDYELNQQQRTERFELPSLLHIGGAYDFLFDTLDINRLTVVANFTSNSFYNDQIGVGVEYGFREMFMARLGYKFEKGMMDKATSITAENGLSGGVTVEVPFKKDSNSSLGLDYSYRTTNSNFSGTHSFGVRLTL